MAAGTRKHQHGICPRQDGRRLPPGSAARVFFHCVTLVCHAGARLELSSSLRGSYCPAGSEQSLGLRIERNPPTRLRVRPSWHRPACGPSPFLALALRARAQPASPPAGLAARSPHAPAESLLSPAGRSSPPPPRSPVHPHAGDALARALASLAERTELRAGGFQFAPRVSAAMPPEAAGTRRADRDGVSATRTHADTEGPRPGTRCRVAVEGVSVRSAQGRARAERPRTRVARNEAPSPRDKEQATKWQERKVGHPRDR